MLPLVEPPDAFLAHLWERKAEHMHRQDDGDEPKGLVEILPVELHALAVAVAERTLRCPVRLWDFGVGSVLSGMVRVGQMLGEATYVDWADRLVAPTLTAPAGPADHLIAVEALSVLRSARPDLDIEPSCARWIDTMLNAQRLTPSGPRIHWPDLEPWSSTIWVDCMHTDGPALAALGQPDKAVEHSTEYASVLQRDDGLFHHGYDALAERGNGIAWGRGQAWALLGLVDTLRQAADPDLNDRLTRLVESFARHEDGGRWHTIVDDPDSPLEHSVAAYVAYAVRRAVTFGLVEEEFGAMADRAFDATVQAVSKGALPVSEATPVGDASAYTSRSTGVFPWGQAPVLHAVVDRLEGEAQRRKDRRT